MLQRIISGGQTGVDRAALDVALELGIPCGGWCPRGRRAEDGPIAETYPLRETSTKEYPQRTEQNVCDAEKCCLVVTTGGTGPARRDVTPEATEAVCDKLLDGFGELMRAVSLRVVPTAILSRQIAGTRGRSLIVNLPGKPSAIRDCLLAVFPAIPYCIDLIEGPYLTTNEGVVKAFRPKK